MNAQEGIINLSEDYEVWNIIPKDSSDKLSISNCYYSSLRKYSNLWLL